jgi:hypothetical protein
MGSSKLDIYGGVIGSYSQPPSGFFKVATDRKRLLTPLGNPYWVRGVFDCDMDTINSQAQLLSNWGRWGGEAGWGVAVASRLKHWGFNCAAEYASAYVVAVDQYATRNVISPIPSVGMWRPAYYSLAKGIKNIATVGSLPDVFDPAFAAFCASDAWALTSPATIASPWIIGTAIGDLDDLCGFGPGPGASTIPAGHASPHIGDMVLNGPTSFTKTALSSFPIDTILAMFVDKFFSVTTAALRAADPNHLVFGPATLNGWGGLSRPQVLASAAKYCDVVQASAGNLSILESTLAATGNVPLCAWMGATANADSELAGSPDATPSLPTQQARGEWYASELRRYFSYPNFCGVKLWAWEDSWAEKANWGLVSFEDEPYVAMVNEARKANAEADERMV